MGSLKCCVSGCNATGDSHRLYSVPKDDKLRSLWMHFLVPNNWLLIGLTTEQLVRKRVCQRHFERCQVDGQGRRTRFLYPCLFTGNEIAHGTSLSSEEYNVLSEHNYHQIYEEADNNDNSEMLLVISKADDNVHLYEHSYASYLSTLSEGTTKNMDLDISTKQKDAGAVVHEHEQSYPSCSSAIPSYSYDGIHSKITTCNSTQKRKASTTTKKMTSKRKFIGKVKEMTTDSFGKSSLQRLNKAQELCQNDIFIKNVDALSKQAKILLIMQSKLAARNKMARRFSIEEKLIALSLLKQSPKGYNLLEKMFALPNKRTLNRLSEKISFEPGMNNKVFKYVQAVTKSCEKNKKLCTITFDELALSPHLTYNESKNVIDGFVELGERKFNYCDHALVFMIRGICSPWRQSLSYYFCEGTVSAIELVHILKESALNQIRKDTVRSRNAQGIRDNGTIEIAGMDLNIFYDPPHLLKSIRNNFLTKNMIFDGKIGSWKDIMFIFDIDSELGHTRALPKLTAHHVIPNKIKKMKVSAASQVLSARTAAMLKYTNALNIRNKEDPRENKNDPNTMATTAEIVEFFDKLFDSVNGSPGCSKRGKLRSAVKENSPHVGFWLDAIQKLKKIQFQDCNSKAAIQAGQPRLRRVPCLEGWVTTLESFVRMTKLLLIKYGVEYYYPRCVNQDPLENFFGRIRAINYRNVNPDAHIFMCSFKALILANVLSPHSRFRNCEEDDGDTLLDLNFLFEEDGSNKENVSQVASSTLSSSPRESEQSLATQVIMEKIKVQCSAYTAGYVCRHLSKFIKCNTCIKTYTTHEIDSIHKFIQFREYKNLKRSNLAYPNQNFLRFYREAAQHIHSFLNIHAHERQIGQNIKNILCTNLSSSWLGCRQHHNAVLNKTINIIIRIQVHNWCKIINKIFRGDIEAKYIRNMDMPQKMAYKKYEKLKLKPKTLIK